MSDLRPIIISSIPWALVRNADFQASPRLPESEFNKIPTR